jgi:hypothetical protein
MKDLVVDLGEIAHQNVDDNRRTQNTNIAHLEVYW